jgi:hypothetical protein
VRLKRHFYGLFRQAVSPEVHAFTNPDWRPGGKERVRKQVRIMVGKWFVVVVTVSLVMSSPMVTFASTRSCSESLNDPQTLHVRWVPAPGIDEAVTAKAQEEIEIIWRRYGVTIVWAPHWSPASGAMMPDLFIQFVEGPAPTKNNNAIAWIPFANGVPLPYARVSRPAAMRLLVTKAWFDDRRLVDQSPDIQVAALGRIVGRALAHEIGHFLIAKPGHAKNGLMRAAIDPTTLTHPGREYFKLERDDERAMRAARLASCELARLTSSDLH